MIRTAYLPRANWKVWLFVLLLMPLLLWLGFWQLDRAEQKREMLARYQQQRSAPALSAAKLFAADPAALAHRRVRLRGDFLADYSLLLDNQILDGRVGYQLLQPFRSEQGLLLVNRGWLPGPPDRSMPLLPVAPAAVELTAAVYIPAGQAVVLREDDWSANWPLRVQSVDVQRFADKLGQSVFPYVLRIEPAQPGALEVYWPPVNTRPEKHTGYAVQWFAMAAALLLCGIFASLRPRAGVPAS